jgi:hypothetical protein
VRSRLSRDQYCMPRMTTSGTTTAKSPAHTRCYLRNVRSAAISFLFGHCFSFAKVLCLLIPSLEGWPFDQRSADGVGCRADSEHTPPLRGTLPKEGALKRGEEYCRVSLLSNMHVLSSTVERFGLIFTARRVFLHSFTSAPVSFTSFYALARTCAEHLVRLSIAHGV